MRIDFVVGSMFHWRDAYCMATLVRSIEINFNFLNCLMGFVLNFLQVSARLQRIVHLLKPFTSPKKITSSSWSHVQIGKHWDQYFSESFVAPLSVLNYYFLTIFLNLLSSLALVISYSKIDIFFKYWDTDIFLFLIGYSIKIIRHRTI